MKPPAPHTRNFFPLIFMNLRTLSEAWLRGLIATIKKFLPEVRDGTGGEVARRSSRSPVLRAGRGDSRGAQPTQPAGQDHKAQVGGLRKLLGYEAGAGVHASSQASRCWRLAAPAAPTAMAPAIHTR